MRNLSVSVVIIYRLANGSVSNSQKLYYFNIFMRMSFRFKSVGLQMTFCEGRKIPPGRLRWKEPLDMALAYKILMEVSTLAPILY